MTTIHELIDALLLWAEAVSLASRRLNAAWSFDDIAFKEIRALREAVDGFNEAYAAFKEEVKRRGEAAAESIRESEVQ